MKFSLLLLVSLGIMWSSASEDQPNIVLILIDDLGAEAVGCYGGESYPTPNMDALAERGMRFDNAFSQPACMVSRVTLLTGRYPFRSGLTYNDTSRVRNKGWGDGEITFANLLRDAGYATAISGKWQLCEHEKRPHHLDMLGFTHQNLWGWWRGDVTTRRYWGPTFFREKEWVEEPTDVYGPDLFCGYLTDFMRDQVEAKTPFVAFYSMALIHHPFPRTPDNLNVPQPGWIDENDLLEHPNQKWSKANFEAMISYTDKLVGRMVSQIDNLGIADDTLIILTADNGTIHRVTSLYQGCEVKGGKMRTNEAGTRVPFIAVWPGRIEAGSVNHNLIDFSDLLPTLAKVTGSTVPEDRMIDGVSFASQLFGDPQAQSRNWVYARYREEAFVRGARYRLHENGQLYDLAKDRYSPEEVERADSLPRNHPEAEATKERMRLRKIFQQLGHKVGPQNTK